MVLWWNGKTVEWWYGGMAKRICEVNLWCVPILQRADGETKDKPVIFILNMEILHSIEFRVYYILVYLILLNFSLLRYVVRLIVYFTF